MARCRPQFVLPGAVDERLEGLLQRARSEGNQISRSDIVAALIWHAPVDGDALGVMVRQCRRDMQRVAPVEPMSHPPGPRPLSATGRHDGA